MGEFLRYGYKSNIGNMEVKFPLRDSSRQILPFSVGLTDGLCKLILMVSIVAFCKELEFGNEELQDPQLRMVLASFSQIRCSYSHYENPAHFCLHSLSFFSVIDFLFWFFFWQQLFSVWFMLFIYASFCSHTSSAVTKKLASFQQKNKGRPQWTWWLNCNKLWIFKCGN